MKSKTLAALLVALLSGSLLGQQNDSIKVGDLIVIQLSGEPAKEFAKRSFTTIDSGIVEGLQVQLTASVAQIFPDGTLRVECSHARNDTKPARLITLQGTVDRHQINTDITAKGTKIYSAPGAEPSVTTEELRTRRLELRDLKRFKLRTWTMTDEIGN